MPNIRNIISIINDSLKGTCFSTRKFQGASYNSLAYLIVETESKEGEGNIIRPTIVSSDGDCKNMSIDDNYPLFIYHRNTSLSYADTPESETFGDPANDVIENAEMVLICIGDRSKLQVVQEDVAAAIWQNVPRNLTVAQLQANKLEKVIIEPGEVNVTMNEVWNQEMTNVDLALAPENFMLSIKYKIMSVYGKCFQLCN